MLNNISSFMSFAAAGFGQTGPMGGISAFDALLSSMETDTKPSRNSSRAGTESISDILSITSPFSGFAGDFIDNINASLNNIGALMNPALAPKFAFTGAFESTFGLRGPLPDFITVMTSALKLNATQNLAFQDIAVKYKDIVKTPESVQKVAFDLDQAGIGYSHLLV